MHAHRFMLRTHFPEHWDEASASVTVRLPCFWDVDEESTTPAAPQLAGAIVYMCYHTYSYPSLPTSRLQLLSLMMLYNAMMDLGSATAELAIDELASAFEDHSIVSVAAAADAASGARRSSTASGAGAGAGAAAGAGGAPLAENTELAAQLIAGNAEDNSEWAVIAELADLGALDRLPSSLTAAMEEARVHQELMLLAGKECGACKGRIPRGRDDCPNLECMATPLTEPPSLVRLPSGACAAPPCRAVVIVTVTVTVTG